MNTTTQLLTILFLLTSSLPLWSQKYSGVLTSILDGDTYVVTVDQEEIKIRLNGVDCPESDQPFGYEATLFVTQYLNRRVEFTKLKLDRYKRTVAEVYIDGQRLSILLVANGLAHHFVKYSSDPALAQAEKVAKSKKLGLWSQANIIEPWIWREPSEGRYTHEGTDGKTKITVFICGSKTASKYHVREGCAGLSRCNSGIYIISKSDALSIGLIVSIWVKSEGKGHKSNL